MNDGTFSADERLSSILLVQYTFALTPILSRHYTLGHRPLRSTRLLGQIQKPLKNAQFRS